MLNMIMIILVVIMIIMITNIYTTNDNTTTNYNTHSNNADDNSINSCSEGARLDVHAAGDADLHREPRHHERGRYLNTYIYIYTHVLCFSMCLSLYTYIIYVHIYTYTYYVYIYIYIHGVCWREPKWDFCTGAFGATLFLQAVCCDTLSYVIVIGYMLFCCYRLL